MAALTLKNRETLSDAVASSAALRETHMWPMFQE
jgi:hypothetical protein